VLAWSCVLASKALWLVALLGGAGALLLLLVLARGLDDLLGSAILLLGAAYVLALYAGEHVLDQGVPLVAAGLLACAELANWSLEERLPVAADRGLLVARARAVGILVGAGLAASALVLAVTAAPVGGGLAWTVLGAAAAVVALAVVARAARRSA
jgi:hypothetical protein